MEETPDLGISTLFEWKTGRFEDHNKHGRFRRRCVDALDR